MQQSSPIQHLLHRAGAGLVLALLLGALIPTPGHATWADERESTPATMEDFRPALLLAFAGPPDFLTTTPAEETLQKEGEGIITPFLGVDRGLTLLPIPERPTIAAYDRVPRERADVTAGVDVDMGTFKLNLGYTLPSRKVDSVVHPLGVDLEAGGGSKQFSLGVKFPF